MGNNNNYCCNYASEEGRDKKLKSTLSKQSSRRYSKKNGNKPTNNLVTNQGVVTTNQNAIYTETGNQIVKDILKSKNPNEPVKLPNVKEEKEVPLELSEEKSLRKKDEAEENKLGDKDQKPAVRTTLVAPEMKMHVKSEVSKGSPTQLEIKQIRGNTKINRSDIKKSEHDSKTWSKNQGQFKNKRSEGSKGKKHHSIISISSKKKGQEIVLSKHKNPNLSKVNEEEKNMEEDKQLDGMGFDCFEVDEQDYDKYSAKLALMYEKYSFKEYLGVGVYSEVRRVVNNFTQESFSMKILKKDYLKKEKPVKPVLDYLVSSEHKNVTKVIEYFQDKKFYYVVYEFNQGGMMFDYICETVNYDKKMIANIIKQILSALLYNQGQGNEIYHKEIRPENLMIEDALLDIINLKINDFSTCVEYNGKNKKKKQMKQTFSSIYFLPPEVIANIGYQENSDIWSTGILLYILFTGINPIKDISNKFTIKNIKSKNFKIPDLVKTGIIEEEAGDLLQKMLERDCRKRISIIDAMNHPWVIKYSKEEVGDAIISINIQQKITQFWNLYSLQEICMKYFGFLTLNSMRIDSIETEAEKEGIRKADQCDYDQLFDILMEVTKNSKESVEFELKNTLKNIKCNNDSGTYTFGDFLSGISKAQEEFCEAKIRTNLARMNPEGKMKCDDVRRMLIEREDSINPDWNDVLKKFSIKNTDQIGYDMFIKVFKEFRC
ncbi:unnamed protein product [Moneuplotes crassus]|uniref:Protein kinase domain-containing protein n=1 Tax=Euplotes crassus TaxID=5936 RepID=A0AAD1Y8B5_EUPCR|nr:unnamed protein product [Moneuplotes crassus]